MSPNEYVERANERMRADGKAVTPVAFADARGYVSYQSKRRLQWIATKLHLFTFVVAAPVASPEVLESSTEGAVAYAKRQQGTTRSGVGVAVAIALVAARINPQAETVIEAGSNPPLSDMIRATITSLAPMPQSYDRGSDILVERVIVDPSNGRVHGDTGRARWGAMYRPWIRTQLLAALPQVA